MPYRVNWSVVSYFDGKKCVSLPEILLRQFELKTFVVERQSANASHVPHFSVYTFGDSIYEYASL